MLRSFVFLPVVQGREIPSTNREIALYALGGLVLIGLGVLLIFVSGRRKRPYDGDGA